jgi:hypothetical protein
VTTRAHGDGLLGTPADCSHSWRRASGHLRDARSFLDTEAISSSDADNSGTNNRPYDPGPAPTWMGSHDPSESERREPAGRNYKQGVLRPDDGSGDGIDSAEPTYRLKQIVTGGRRERISVLTALTRPVQRRVGVAGMAPHPRSRRRWVAGPERCRIPRGARRHGQPSRRAPCARTESRPAGS